MTWEEDVREADIVNLAVVSTRCSVNHAYFASICSDALYTVWSFAHYSVKLVLAFTMCAPIAHVELIYLLIRRSLIKGCLVGHRLLLLKSVPVLFSGNFQLQPSLVYTL